MKKVILIFTCLVLAFTARAQNDIATNAERFFRTFISGDIDSAYSFLAKDFTDKVSKTSLLEGQKAFIQKYGAFKEISAILPLKQQDKNYVVISTSFAEARPLFALYFDADMKIVGLFNTAENFSSKYVDPPYADKNLYVEKDIAIQSDEFRLPGILTTPKTATKYPVVVLVHGSGVQDRDETVENVKPFRDLALGLAAKGIATIRYDKRTKVYGINSVPKDGRLTIQEETISDAVAAIRMAGKLPGANPSKVYLLGHSLGAMMAPRIAESTPALAGIIEMAMPARSFADMLADQFKYLFSLQPQNEQKAGALKAAMDMTVAIKNADTLKNQDDLLMGASAYYWSDLNKYNQVEAAKKVKIPMLILQGERDYNVTLKDFNILKENLSGKKNVTFISYPLLNHAFTAGTGAMSTPAEFGVPANIPIKVIDDIATFILKK